MADDPSDVYLRYQHLRERAAEQDAALQQRGLSNAVQLGRAHDGELVELLEEFGETSRDLGDAAGELAEAIGQAI